MIPVVQNKCIGRMLTNALPSVMFSRLNSISWHQKVIFFFLLLLRSPKQASFWILVNFTAFLNTENTHPTTCASGCIWSALYGYLTYKIWALIHTDYHLPRFEQSHREEHQHLYFLSHPCFRDTVRLGFLTSEIFQEREYRQKTTQCQRD